MFAASISGVFDIGALMSWWGTHGRSTLLRSTATAVLRWVISLPQMQLCTGTQETIIVSASVKATIRVLIRWFNKMFLFGFLDCNAAATLKESVKVMDCYALFMRCVVLQLKFRELLSVKMLAHDADRGPVRNWGAIMEELTHCKNHWAGQLHKAGVHNAHNNSTHFFLFHNKTVHRKRFTLHISLILFCISLSATGRIIDQFCISAKLQMITMRVTAHICAVGRGWNAYLQLRTWKHKFGYLALLKPSIKARLICY